MKSSPEALRILLDTSFLLPTLGIDVGQEVSRTLAWLAEAEAEVYYSRFSLLESLWVASRIIRDQAFDPQLFNLGLRSVIEGSRYRKVDEDSEVFSEALRLYQLGHEDMIDNILYASSLRLDLRLLTLDSSLREFILNKGLKETVLFPSDTKL